MKKLLTALMLFINLNNSATNSFAALGAGVNWDVRTTGVSTNGGGFNGSPYTATPSVPSVAMGGNGTVALDEYYTVITYTDTSGETKASGETYLNVNSASTDTIVVTSPAASTNAINYKVYIGTVLGGPYFIQNSTGTAVGTNYTRTTTPATTGDQPSMTDYSQQDTAQLTLTDGATTGVGVTTLTSATGGFTIAMVGNLLFISSGTNTLEQYFEIIEWTDTNTVTLDRAPDDGVGAVSGANFKVGGASDHPSTFSPGVVAGNISHIKNGNYVKVGANDYVFQTTVAGGNGTPITWIGYNSTHLDWPLDTTRPHMNGDSNGDSTADTGYALYGSTITNNIFRNIRFSKATTAAVGSAGNTGVSWVFIDCKMSDSVDGFAGDDVGLINVEITGNSDAAFDSSISNWASRLYGVYIHDNTNEGWYNPVGSGSVHSFNGIYETNGATAGLGTVGDGITALNNVFYNNTGSTTDGLFWSETGNESLSVAVFNNVSLSNGRYGYNRASSARWPSIFNYNLYNSNGTAGAFNLIAGANDSTGAPSFTDAPGGDFTASSSSSPLVGAGFLQTYPGAVGDYNWNIGADQGDHTTGGSSVTVGYSYGQ